MEQESNIGINICLGYEITDEEDIEEDEAENENKEEKNVAVDNLFYDVCKNENELDKKN